MILVTGATGLVGGHLLWHLLQENQAIYAIKRKTSNLQPLQTIFEFYTQESSSYLSRINWITADVLDFDSISKAFAGIKTVYHCAAIVSLGNGSDQLIATNVKGTENIVKAALKASIEKLCFVSSIAACGHELSGKYIDEESALTDIENRSPYSRSKYLSEQAVWEGIKNGLNAVIVNPGVILGVSGTNSGSSELFARVKKGLPFYTNGGSGYVDVQDVVKIMMQLTSSNYTNERFVLISENCSNKDILSWIAKGYGKVPPKIGIGRKLLYALGFISEIVARIGRFSPILDRGMALSATSRSYYSSQKIIHLLQYQFKPVKKCIDEVCLYDELRETQR